jgi:hypothetical protein
MNSTVTAATAGTGGGTMFIFIYEVTSRSNNTFILETSETSQIKSQTASRVSVSPCVKAY